MKTEFKDVAHLCRGCKCEFIPSLSDSLESDKTYGVIHLFPVHGTEYGMQQVEGFDECVIQYAFIQQIKPILRPLSDMTEEENETYTSFGCDTGTWHGDIELQAERTAYLLKQGFDLFNLIPTGQAIDATTFNK